MAKVLHRSAATMSDVAREAGVALGTVSKVINGQPVGESYRLRVEAAVKKLDYRINNSARSLKTDQTRTIAFIVPNTITPYFALLTHHINMALEKRSYKMLLCFTEYDRDREQEFIQMVRNRRADGVIALTYNPHLEIPEDIPFVTIDRFFSVSVPCVAADNFAGGRMAAHELAARGCRRVAFMRIGSTLTNEPSKRRDGFISGCLEENMSYECMLLEDGASEEEFGVFLKEHMIGGRLEFDGLFCGTDTVAYRVIRMLRGMNLRVPEDVQVIGFDGIRMFGDQDYVCSTIVQPVAAIAETCVNMVLSPDFGALPPLICLPVSYADGGTTKPVIESEKRAI
ncbi:MAG: LacI family DNA-binding transcriptional regulator [Clostridiales bacterium]|nr:LacI family DNA-binding transcriptional regulator [Clostridiales bacterium]MDD7365734.1 LacI family DNA-binding transcriptional regulator [Clostridiales bacterium]MDY2872153.1 LacI family DNA-binding transcriptional regulator [Eubacteriales bacterium]